MYVYFPTTANTSTTTIVVNNYKKNSTSSSMVTTTRKIHEAITEEESSEGVRAALQMGSDSPGFRPGAPCPCRRQPTCTCRCLRRARLPVQPRAGPFRCLGRDLGQRGPQRASVSPVGSGDDSSPLPAPRLPPGPAPQPRDWFAWASPTPRRGRAAPARWSPNPEMRLGGAGEAGRVAAERQRARPMGAESGGRVAEVPPDVARGRGGAGGGGRRGGRRMRAAIAGAPPRGGGR